MSLAADFAMSIVCFSSDSRTPPSRPSIVGRMPILGSELLKTVNEFFISRRFQSSNLGGGCHRISAKATLAKRGADCYFPHDDECFRQQAHRICPDRIGADRPADEGCPRVG